MKKEEFRIVGVGLVVSLSSFILLPSSFGQGALTPPGAPAPTMKTLDQVEPRTPITNLPVTISQPGSYYLTTNLTGATGITIDASGVSLDLMGFELVGGTGDGITVSGGNRTNIAVRNGTIRGWSSDGVDLVNGRSCQLERLAVSSNGSAGIIASDGSTVSGCTAQSNVGAGISAGDGSTVSGCTARLNTGNGITATACTVSGCMASLNTGDGIAASISTVNGCTARGNVGDGIDASSASTVDGCTARSNGGDGIVAGADCHVRDNTCNNNGFGAGIGAGIHVSSSDNRIDSNNVTDNDWGIKADADGNLIIRNSASGNGTNYVFTGTQTFGPTNTVTSEITDTNPWRNFSY